MSSDDDDPSDLDEVSVSRLLWCKNKVTIVTQVLTHSNLLSPYKHISDDLSSLVYHLLLLCPDN